MLRQVVLGIAVAVACMSWAAQAFSAPRALLSKKIQRVSVLHGDSRIPSRIHTDSSSSRSTALFETPDSPEDKEAPEVKELIEDKEPAVSKKPFMIYVQDAVTVFLVLVISWSTFNSVISLSKKAFNAFHDGQ